MFYIKNIILIIILFLLTACNNSIINNMPIKIRKPAFAGQFYNSNKESLKVQIKKYLEKDGNNLNAENIMAIIVPHAGYDYSGQVAAASYKIIKNKNIKTVFLISNAHATHFNGIAIDDSNIWETPLGKVEVDKEKNADLLSYLNSYGQYNSEAHTSDHVLEVQIPFLQTVLPEGFKIVPILFGNNGKDDYKKLATGLSKILTVDDLIVISSDMSHYPSYADANIIDKKTLDIIKEKNIIKLDDHIRVNEGIIPNEETLLCGIDAVKTVMELSNLLNWQMDILKYANSGDTDFGDKNNVVGYGALAFFEKINNNKELSAEQQNELLEIAKRTVKSYILNNTIPVFKINDKRLNIKEGAFVTLHKNGQLRGCIGQIIPNEDPLWKVVQNMAIEAASQDPRFKPLNKDELNEIDYEVSVLSSPQKISDWRNIELGRHGVIIKNGWHSGVFLPQVAEETNWDLKTFLEELSSQKAGLPPDSYKDKDTEIFTFTAQVIK